MTELRSIVTTGTGHQHQGYRGELSRRCRCRAGEIAARQEGGSAVLRGPLAAKGGDAFTCIGMVQVAYEMVALGGQLGMQGRGLRVVDQFLDAGQRVGRA